MALSKVTHHYLGEDQELWLKGNWGLTACKAAWLSAQGMVTPKIFHDDMYMS